MNKINSLNIGRLLSQKDKNRFLFLVSQMVFVALLEFAGIALVLPFIKLAGNQLDLSKLPSFVENWIGGIAPTTLVIYTGIGIFFLILISTLLKIYLSWKEHKFVWDISHKLCTQQHRNVLARPYTFFIEKNSTEIITHLLLETTVVVRGILLPIAQIISNAIVALLFLALITAMHPRISFIFLVVSFAVGFVLITLLKKRLSLLGQRRLTLERTRFRHLKESIVGVKTVKTSQKELFFLNKFSGASKQYSQIRPFLDTLNLVPKRILDIVLFGGIVLLVTVLMWRRSDVIGILPSLIFYVFVGMKLLPTFQNIIASIITIRYSWPSLDVVLQGLANPTTKDFSQPLMPPLQFSDSLQLTNCYFGHLEDTAILKDVSIEIKKGSKVGIVGYSGSGKSTLVEILSGLLVPDSGQLSLDDQLIDETNIAQLMQLMSFVPQDVFFFDDSLEKNITLEENTTAQDRKKLLDILDILALQAFVDELPDGLETQAGEHGVKLSGGQKQRFGFARALYKEPEILILDESTSALDYLTEVELLENLKKRLPGLTVLKVAHRLKSVRDCDVIYVLDQGQVIARGTFEQVVENNELFKEMVRAGTI